MYNLEMSNIVETEPVDSDPVSPTQSTAMRRSPRLSTQGLTIMLAAMCAVPAITILVLWQILPPAEEGKLKVTVDRVGVPDIDYYFDDIGDREDVQDAYLLIRNDSESEWEHIFVKVNKHYDIKDQRPLAVGGERRYLLNRFISRTGARFDMRQIPLRHIRIFAKQVNTGARATFNVEFPDMILKR